MFTIPCGDQTQLSSPLISLGIFRYLPSMMSISHSTREKPIRHWSPSFGGHAIAPAYRANAFHGNAISTNHPLSVSLGSLSEPSTDTPDFKPSMFVLSRNGPWSMYGFSSVSSQIV